VSVAWAAYRSLAPVLGVAAPLARWVAPGAERSGWSERLGDVPAGAGVDAWIHAASLGEAVAMPALVRELRAAAPSATLRLTSTTRTGRARLADLGELTSLAPFDTPQATERFLDRVRPRRILLLETELWPHWLLAARRRGVAVAVLNARLSARSLERYRWMGRGFAALIQTLGAVLCQSDTDRTRWLALGAPLERTATVGNLKHDGWPAPSSDRGAVRAALGLDAARRLWVLGSVRPEEVTMLAAAWQQIHPETRARWQVVAVPRHTAASPGLRREASEAGIALTDAGAPPGGAWRWDDRPGVLMGYYQAANLAFVGGSLGPYGGHNPLEPAACGAAVFTGPHLESQGPAVEALEAHDALTIAHPGDSLASTLRSLLEDDGLRERRATAARAAADAARGATHRAVERLVEWKVWPA